jgi:predicted small lipoprotein YifL
MHTTRVLLLAVLFVLAACGPASPSAQPPAGTPGPAQPITITTVEVLSAESFPVQVSLHVRGAPPGAGCWSAPVTDGPVRLGFTIAITVTAAPAGLPPSTACEAWTYDRTFPLGSDLMTGDYLVRVNNVEQPFHFEAGYGP